MFYLLTLQFDVRVEEKNEEKAIKYHDTAVSHVQSEEALAVVNNSKSDTSCWGIGYNPQEVGSLS